MIANVVVKENATVDAVKVQNVLAMIAIAIVIAIVMSAAIVKVNTLVEDVVMGAADVEVLWMMHK
jgi:hypothetical protein